MTELGDLKISSSQARAVLAVLVAADSPLSTVELAALSGVTMSTAYYTVARLREAGWLTGTAARHPTGQGYQRWALTAAARKAHQEGARPRRQDPGDVSRQGRRILAFLLEHAPTYGLEISQALGISHTTVFGLLSRYERWGWLSSSVTAPSGVRGRPPVMYRFTDAGALVARRECGG